jgi:bacterial/archaeal transporter family-2 protein
VAREPDLVLARDRLFRCRIPLSASSSPTSQGVAAMPWWALLGGLVCAVAVVTGLLFVDRVGTGVFAGLTITANIVISLLIDQFGLFNMPQHPLGTGRVVGALFLIAGVALISRY